MSTHFGRIRQTTVAGFSSATACMFAASVSNIAVVLRQSGRRQDCKTQRVPRCGSEQRVGSSDVRRCSSSGKCDCPLILDLSSELLFAAPPEAAILPAAQVGAPIGQVERSEERRVGKEG